MLGSAPAYPLDFCAELETKTVTLLELPLHAEARPVDTAKVPITSPHETACR